MLWKNFRCKDCEKIQENVNSKAEDTERECPACGGTAKVVLTPKFTRFKGFGWSTRRPVEAFPGESEYTEDWNADTHGLASVGGPEED